MDSKKFDGTWTIRIETPLFQWWETVYKKGLAVVDGVLVLEILDETLEQYTGGRIKIVQIELRKSHISINIEIERMGELLMAVQHNQQFKEEAVRYYLDHKDLRLRGCAENLGIGYSTLGKWVKDYNANNGTVPTCGSGNYSSDVEKENARLKRELRDAKDTLDVLKKPSEFWENDRSNLS